MFSDIEFISNDINKWEMFEARWSGGWAGVGRGDRSIDVLLRDAHSSIDIVYSNVKQLII